MSVKTGQAHINYIGGGWRAGSPGLPGRGGVVK